MAEAPKPKEDLIPIDTAARLLMVSGERVRQLIKAGYIPRPVPGKTTLVGAVQGYIRFLKDEDRRSSKSAADSRLRDAKAADVEMRMKERERSLIPVEDSEVAFDFLVHAVNDAVRSIPARITRGDPELRRKVEAECNAALAQIAQALRKAVQAARTGSDPSNAGPLDKS